MENNRVPQKQHILKSIKKKQIEKKRAVYTETKLNHHVKKQNFKNAYNYLSKKNTRETPLPLPKKGKKDNETHFKLNKE